MPVISPQGLESKSCYTCANGPTAKSVEHIVLSFGSVTGSTYDVPVYAGSMYKITYYDSAIQNVRTITGMVTGVNTSTIAVEVITVLDAAGNICLCTNRDKLAGYLSAEYFYVPVQNISKIEAVDPYATDTTTPTPSERSEEFVSILGISSTVIRAVIVRLKIFQDDIRHTVTPVDMVVGNSYHVTFAKNNSVYELEGRLVRIEEIGLYGNETTECGYVRQDTSNDQVVGAGNNIYDPNYFYTLPKYNPDGVKIRFLFDTSRDFIQRFDTVMLGDIRNVHPIGPCPGPTPPPMPGPTPPMPPYPPVPPTPQPPCPPPMPPYPPVPPAPHPPCPPPMPPYPPYYPWDDPHRPGPWPPCEPCDPSYPVGPGDVPPSGEDSGTTTTDTATSGNGFNPTTTTTTSAPMYQSLNNQQDTINNFNKI